MSKPLSPAADAQVAKDASNAANQSAWNASNATYTTSAPKSFLEENIAIYVLVFVDGMGLVLNVLVFMVLIQVSLPKTKAFCSARCFCPLLPCAPFIAYAVVVDMSSCGGADCSRRCRT